MTRHQTRKIRNTLSQASIPKVEKVLGGNRAGGLLLRGCVTATYVVDDPGRSNNDSYWLGETSPVAVYCDVLCYTGMSGNRYIFLRKVLVAQDRGGIHNGRIWKPKAATLDISGDFVPDGGTNPANWDGDHVLVGFLEDSLNLPVILAGVPHPIQDTGGLTKTVGHRLRLTVADGDPDFHKHYGSFFGLDDSGNFVVDLTGAYKGPLQATGAEPAPPGNGTVGNVTVKLPTASKLTVQIDGGASLELDLKDAAAKLKLGDGAVHAAIAETLKTFLDTTLKAWLTAHTHPTGVGPSGPPSPAPAYPVYNDAITSTKLAFPNG